MARQQGQNRARDRVPPRARADAGLHRRARGGRSRRDARRDDRARGRSEQDQSAGAGRPRHRPFGRGRLRRHLEVARPERGARIRAEPGALPLPQVGPAGVLQLLRRPARHRHLPSGQSGISGADGLDRPRKRKTARRSRSPIPTRWSAPTATPPWSTASPCSAGASAGSRPRRPCSASRSRCCCPR